MLFLFISCAFVNDDEFSKRMDPDGDGVILAEDCDSTTSQIGAAQIWFFDEDGDGFGDASVSKAFCEQPAADWVVSSTDCDDTDATINFGGIEVCDGLDNNCDGLIDDVVVAPSVDIGGTLYYVDSDEDGYGDDQQVVQACSAPEGYVAVAGDCDDELARTYPGAQERCDGLDNDCNGLDDDNAEIPMYEDIDGDGYTTSLEPEYRCPSYLQEGFTEEAKSLIDCDDRDDEIYPTQEEVCDDLDNNCDGIADEGLVTSVFVDGDGDGYGTGDLVQECINLDGSVSDGFSFVSGDCDDSDFLVYPGQEEFCDGIDNNCNEEIDEGVKVTYFTDADGDGYGDIQNSFQSCPSAQYTLQIGDCDDSNDNVYPSAAELCDGLDNNCNGNLSSSEDDIDGDGYVSCTIDSGGWFGSFLVVGGDDCDDQSAITYPGAAFNDSGTACLKDVDGDGYASLLGGGTDCDDADYAVHPSATEIPVDGIDQNCDSFEVCPFDADGDGFSSLETTVLSSDLSCFVEEEDCNDNDSEIYPGAPESSSTTDYNCDGLEELDDTCSSSEVLGVYFLICTNEVDWSTAHNNCLHGGYNFASIASPSENLHLSNRVDPSGAWIGYKDTSSTLTFCGPEMSYSWIDGQLGLFEVAYDLDCNQSPTINGYNSWAVGEPDNGNGQEECVAIGQNSTWRDLDCSQTREYICEQR